MKRRELLKGSWTLGVGAGILITRPGRPSVRIADEIRLGDVTARPESLPPPVQGPIPVAFTLADEVTLIDFCGPWDIFQNARLKGRPEPLFHPYTVAATSSITANGGLRIAPSYTFDSAPQPKVIVVPGQACGEPSEALIDWVRRTSPHTDLTMSVCLGAFVLARAGLLDGTSATTHHNAYPDLSMQYPTIRVKRGLRFVEAGNLATAAGQYSGIDLALRVVERYFGRDVAQEVAYFTEYQGLGWIDMDSNQVYRKHPVASSAYPLCPVCEMEVDPGGAYTSIYRGRRFYFCRPSHQVAFERAPDQYLAML